MVAYSFSLGVINDYSVAIVGVLQLLCITVLLLLVYYWCVDWKYLLLQFKVLCLDSKSVIVVFHR